MYTLLVAVCLGFFPIALSKTCTECKTTYSATTKGADNNAKCTALSTYLTCLETSAKGEAGCPLPRADAGAIESDYTGATCSTSPTFTDTCNCQKTFWKTAQSDEAATCTEARKYLTCLKRTTDKACDGTSSVAALTAGVETRMKALTGCSLIPITLSKTCTVCKTEYGTARTAAATDNTKKCTALSTYLTCLEASAEGDDGCPLPSADAGAIETDYTAASCSTSFTDTCICQKTFWKTAQADDAATCTAYKNELHCLGAAKTSTGCDGSTTKSAIATTAETERAKLTTTSASTCPAPTSTCQCEITAAKGDNSDSTKYCSVLKTMETCLSAIKTTAEAGCTSTTQATLLTSTTEMYKKEKCASAGAGADHVTSVVTPLLVSVLASIFL